MASLQVLSRSQLIFPSKTWFFGNLLEFSAAEKRLQNQGLPYCESKSYQINSIKSCSFQKIQLNFQSRNRSIFKNFSTASPNVMEPSPCTPASAELSMTPRTRCETSRFGGSHNYKIKQTTFLHR